jgi:phage shock protein C
MSSTIKKSLYKSTEYRFFTGVASGIAEYLNVSHSSIRLLFILFTLASGMGLVLYITLSVLLPTENEIIEREDMSFYYNITHGILNKKNLESSHNNLDMIYQLVSKQNIIALSIVFIGILFLRFNLVPWNLIPEIGRYPAIIITVGLGFLLKSITQKKL